MRLFQLIRLEDVSGVSGTGLIAEGVEFSSGQCVLHWLTGDDDTIGVYRDVDRIRKVHGHGGKTVLRYQTALQRGLQDVPGTTSLGSVSTDS